MTNRDTAPAIQDLNTGLLAGAAVLVGVGSALGLVGLGLAAAALVAAAGRRYKRTDLTPTQHARLKWDQARAATSAGTGAWKGVDRNRYARTPVR